MQEFAPRSRVLNNVDEETDILVFLSGHSGEGFTKFRDYDEMGSEEFDEIASELQYRHPYRKLMYLMDTCQAISLADRLFATNTALIGSSLRGESAYSCMDDDIIASSLFDRFTRSLFSTFADDAFNLTEHFTLTGLLDSFDTSKHGITT